VGILERGAESDGLGGRIDLKITPGGLCTGRVALGRRVLSLTPGSISTTLGSADVTGSLVLNRAPQPPLQVSFVINTSTGRISVGSIGSSAFTAWKKGWIPGYLSHQYDGRYTFTLGLPSPLVGLEAIPQGTGFGSFQVPQRLDGIHITGKTADGDGFTSSSFLGPDGDLALFDDLPSRGSLLGILTIIPGTEPGFDDNVLTGTPTWSRPANAAVNVSTYRAGFSAISMVLEGGSYLPPASGTLLLGKSLPPQPDNASLSFLGGGIGGPPSRVDRTVSLVPGAQVIIPATSTFPASLTITTATGIFTGGFTLLDVHPVTPHVAPIRRTVTFQGVISGQGSEQRGRGFFLLQQLPRPVYPQPAVLPVLSGQVLLE
jgi:hypothetical protein